jgi:predicted RNA-binding Zn-ribbon protein involved in translation (DUF1610 family)
MPTIRMKVIPEPSRKKRSVIVAPRGDALFRFYRGGNDVDLVCGQCGRELVTGLQDAGQLQSVVLQCPGCGAFNDSGLPAGV